MLQVNFDLFKLWEFIKTFYYILIGDYGDYKDMADQTALSKDVYFIILLVVTVIMVIVMLNMLIALISESHEDVMKLEQQAAVYEKLQLIIDISQNSLRTYKDDLEKNKLNKNELICILKNQKLTIIHEVELDDKIDEIREEVKEISHNLKEVLSNLKNRDA